MTEGDKAETVFGAFDGVVSAVGVIAPLVIASGAALVVVVAAIGLSLNSAWSMGSGQYISDPEKRLRLAVVMGVATLIFSMLPAVPFIFSGGTWAVVAAGALTLAIFILIAELRPGSRRESYLLTAAVGGVGVLLAIAWGFIAP